MRKGLAVTAALLVGTATLAQQLHASPQSSVGEAPDDSVVKTLRSALFHIRDDSVDPIGEKEIVAGAVQGLSTLTGPANAPNGTPKAVDAASLIAWFQQLRLEFAGRVPERRLLKAAIDGMIGTTHLPGGYVDLRSEKRPDASGAASIGISAAIEGNYPTIMNIVAKSPASASLKIGDRVASIDGVSTRGASLDDFFDRLRGVRGSAVSLSIERGGGAPQAISIVRDYIIKPVFSWRVEGKTGIIVIPSLVPDAQVAVQGAIADIKKQVGKPAGYVIDLRNNGGGLRDTAFLVADLLLDAGEMGEERGRGPTDRERFFARRGDKADGRPLVVLIDRGTSGGAEILASALQANHRAQIIGQPSMGVGTVQTILALSDTAFLKVTTSRWFTAAGVMLDGKGIQPDISVPSNDNGQDEALARALSVIDGGVSSAPALR